MRADCPRCGLRLDESADRDEERAGELRVIAGCRCGYSVPVVSRPWTLDEIRARVAVVRQGGTT